MKEALYPTKDNHCEKINILCIQLLSDNVQLQRFTFLLVVYQSISENKRDITWRNYKTTVFELETGFLF